MRQLLLLRHAEAEAARPDLPDFDRPLNAQGRAQALEVARCLQRAGLHPDALLISPAVRTRQTAAIITAELQLAEARQEPALYLGGPQELLPALQRCDPGIHTLLVIGHNPGLSALTRRLAGAVANRVAAGAETALSEDATWQLATAGLCSLTLEGNWAELGPRQVTRVSLSPGQPGG